MRLAHLEFVGALLLVHQALHGLIALDLHNLLVPPLMQSCQLTSPFVDLRLLAATASLMRQE
jgi:hypothetical protein